MVNMFFFPICAFSKRWPSTFCLLWTSILLYKTRDDLTHFLIFWCAMIISSTGFQRRFTDLTTDRDCPRALVESFLGRDSGRGWDALSYLPPHPPATPTAHSPSPTVPFPTLFLRIPPCSSHHSLPSLQLRPSSASLPPYVSLGSPSEAPEVPPEEGVDRRSGLFWNTTDFRTDKTSTSHL